MPQHISIRQRAATSWIRRLRYRVSRLYGSRLQKSQRVYILDVNGHRFKKIVSPDSYTAAQISSTLSLFGESDRIPSVQILYEKELWVEYIEGSPIQEVNEESVRAVADLLAEIHCRNPKRVPTEETSFVSETQNNLHFLHQVGVLSESQHQALQESTLAFSPDSLWVGFDYTDTVLKNFIIADDDSRACAIDVESLNADTLIGMSFAKAAEFWMSSYRDTYLKQLMRPGVPDFRPYLPFVELYFLARSMKRAFVERKWRYVDAERFERLSKPANE